MPSAANSMCRASSAEKAIVRRVPASRIASRSASISLRLATAVAERPPRRRGNEATFALPRRATSEGVRTRTSPLYSLPHQRRWKTRSNLRASRCSSRLSCQVSAPALSSSAASARGSESPARNDQ